MRNVTLTPDQLRLVNEHLVTFDFIVQMPKAPKFANAQEQKDYVPGPGRHVCRVYDIEARKRDKNVPPYLSAEGDDAETAMVAALALVPSTEKPRRTPVVGAAIDPRDAEIAALKAQLAASGATPAAPKGKRGGYRPRKPVDAPQVAAAS